LSSKKYTPEDREHVPSKIDFEEWAEAISYKIAFNFRSYQMSASES